MTHAPKNNHKQRSSISDMGATDATDKPPAYEDDPALDRVARVMAQRPCLIFWIASLLMLLFTGLAFVSGALNISDSNDYTWLNSRASRTKRHDALTQALVLIDSIGNTTIQERSQSSDRLSLSMLYEHDEDSDIFTPALLQAICRIELLVLNAPRYADFCLLDSQGKCATQSQSVVTVFYGDMYNHTDCELLSDEFVHNISAQIYSEALTVEGSIKWGQYVGSDAKDNNPVYTKRSKSTLSFGLPLKGYKDENDREDDQVSKVSDDFFADLEDDFKHYFGLKGTFFKSMYRSTAERDHIICKWGNEAFFNIEILRMLNTDFGWAILSLLFVMIYMRVHIGTTFVAVMSMLQIVLSLPVAAFFYAIGIPYFDFLHILTIFLVLGVGADDVFVYVDAWRQSVDVVDPKNIHHRVVYALGRTARAVLNTSFTTTVAFLSQTGSPLMPVASLGIYAAIAIVLNYIFAITFTPVVVIIQDKYFAKIEFHHAKEYNKPGPGVELATVGPSAKAAKQSAQSFDFSSSGASHQREGDSFVDRIMHKFYADPLLYSMDVCGIKLKPISLFVLFGLLAYAAQGIYFTFELSPPNEQERWFPSDHMWYSIFDDLRNDYLSQSDDEYVGANLVFGIEGIDRSGYSFWRPGENLGTPEFDPKFDIYPLAAQQALFDSCDRLRSYPCTKSGCSQGLLAWPNSVSCVIEQFSMWHNQTYSVLLPSNAMTKEQFYARLEEFRNTFPEYQTNLGFVGGELKFLTFDMTLTMVFSEGYDNTGNVIDATDNFVDDTKDASPEQLQSIFIDGGTNLVFYDAQSALISNLFQGLAICTPVVFILLLITTLNMQIAVAAVACVMFIVASVLGMCKWLGWSLGIAESIAGVIVIGFAVDYTIHLGHMYMEGAHNKFETREERFRFAVHTMGGTIIANSVTTFGSGAFMFGAQMTFFRKMAVLMCTTIAFSVLFSFGLFMAHCAVIGPAGNFANIPNYRKILMERIKSKK